MGLTSHESGRLYFMAHFLGLISAGSGQGVF